MNRKFENALGAKNKVCVFFSSPPFGWLFQRASFKRRIDKRLRVSVETGIRPTLCQSWVRDVPDR